MVRMANPADAIPEPSRPDPLLEAGPQPDAREAYENLLFHGPMFQCIQELRLGSNGGSAVFRTAAPDAMVAAQPGLQWLLDPMVIDGALQMQVVWARMNWEVTLLPTYLDGADILGSFAAVDRVRHEMRILPTSKDPLNSAEHWFHDATTGRPLAYLRGMSGAGSRALNRIVGTARRGAAAGSS